MTHGININFMTESSLKRLRQNINQYQHLNLNSFTSLTLDCEN